MVLGGCCHSYIILFLFAFVMQYLVGFSIDGGSVI